MVDDSSTVREVYYVQEHVTLSDDSNNEADEVHDTLDLSDANYELTCCPSCGKISKLVTWNRDLCCDSCGSNVEYRCGRCHKHYMRIKSLRFHLRNDCNKSASHQCSQCSYVTKRKASLQLHERSQHTFLDKIHSCSMCGKRYKHRFHMLGHEKLCGKDIEFKCDLCTYTCHNPYNLKCHIRNKHTDANALDYYQCMICKKLYKHSKSYYKHKKICGQDFKVFCAHCDHTCSNKNKLLTHLRKEHMEEVWPNLNGRFEPIKKKKVRTKQTKE